MKTIHVAVLLFILIACEKNSSRNQLNQETNTLLLNWKKNTLGCLQLRDVEKMKHTQRSI